MNNYSCVKIFLPVSRFFYKEKLTKIQLAGFVFGLAAVVFLNI